MSRWSLLNYPKPNMATPAMSAAALAQNRHQGGLREFVNQKLSPHVKKALKDVCDVDAEYPLQWLGEHLINQSFLYENNPDATGIKERFFYNFDEPQTSAKAPTAAASTTAVAIPSVTATPAADQTFTNDATIADTTAAIDTQLPSASDTPPGQTTTHLYNGDQGPTDVGQDQSHDDTNIEMLNGVTEAAQEEASSEQVNGDVEATIDAEMEGTS